MIIIWSLNLFLDFLLWSISNFCSISRSLEPQKNKTGRSKSSSNRTEWSYIWCTCNINVRRVRFVILRTFSRRRSRYLDVNCLHYECFKKICASECRRTQGPVFLLLFLFYSLLHMTMITAPCCRGEGFSATRRSSFRCVREPKTFLRRGVGASRPFARNHSVWRTR